MTHIISNILIGFGNFPFFALLFTVPFLIVPVLHYKKFNVMRIFMNYTFLLYLICLIALVFLPLPTLTQANALSTHDIQFIPFMFVADIIRETPFVWNNPSTYLPALMNNAILQLVFNVLMTVPFGMFLRYYFECGTKKVVLYTFLLSLFIEIAQLTGLFFIYNGSYRLCDVDDLITNTLGGYLGCRAIGCLNSVLPGIHFFDRSLVAKRGQRSQVA